jgi:hypothetical protein
MLSIITRINEINRKKGKQMFILIKNDNKTAFINTDNITTTEYDSKTKILSIHYIGMSGISQFEGEDALKIYNHLTSRSQAL